MLTAYVRDRGVHERADWKYVAAEIPGKDARQCFDRFSYLERRRRKSTIQHEWTKE